MLLDCCCELAACLLAVACLLLLAADLLLVLLAVLESVELVRFGIELTAPFDLEAAQFLRLPDCLLFGPEYVRFVFVPDALLLLLFVAVLVLGCVLVLIWVKLEP